MNIMICSYHPLNIIFKMSSGWSPYFIFVIVIAFLYVAFPYYYCAYECEENRNECIIKEHNKTRLISLNGETINVTDTWWTINTIDIDPNIIGYWAWNYIDSWDNKKLIQGVYACYWSKSRYDSLDICESNCMQKFK